MYKAYKFRLYQQILSMKETNRELIINLIDKIEIFEDKTINIKVNFKKI